VRPKIDPMLPLISEAASNSQHAISAAADLLGVFEYVSSPSDDLKRYVNLKLDLHVAGVRSQVKGIEQFLSLSADAKVTKSAISLRDGLREAVRLLEAAKVE